MVHNREAKEINSKRDEDEGTIFGEFFNLFADGSYYDDLSDY